ncbi:hypothetical protein ACFXKX_18545 [Streptomyces scopuliridis]
MGGSRGSWAVQRGLAFGALAGFLGARFAVILRANTPTAGPEGN